MTVSSALNSRRIPLGEKTTTSLLRYFVLIPLLSPKGLDFLIPGYKTFMTFWSMVALATIVLDSVFRLHGRKYIFDSYFGFKVYFVTAILVSVFSSKGIGNGLQELFFFPVAFLYLVELDECEFREYCIASAYILTTLFILQIVVPSSLFAGNYHMTLLGHVQVFSQYGLLALLLASYIYLKNWASRVLSVVLAVLSLVVMLTADADSAHLCIAIFFAVLLIEKFFTSNVRLDFRYIVVLSFIASAAVVWSTVTKRSPLIGTSIDWTFNGRFFVWESAIRLIKESPFFGFGVENSVITTFWSSGMSYAHNQVMQCLVDGGIVLLIAMFWMFCSIGRCVGLISDERVYSVTIATLCALLFVLIFDSFTLYSYVFILLALVSREGMLSGDESFLNGIQGEN